jgi:hypothetical protein
MYLFLEPGSIDDLNHPLSITKITLQPQPIQKLRGILEYFLFIYFFKLKYS